MSEKKQGTKELQESSMRALKLVKAFNNTPPEDTQEKERLIRELFGSENRAGYHWEDDEGRSSIDPQTRSRF